MYKLKNKKLPIFYYNLYESPEMLYYNARRVCRYISIVILLFLTLSLSLCVDSRGPGIAVSKTRSTGNLRRYIIAVKHIELPFAPDSSSVVSAACVTYRLLLRTNIIEKSTIEVNDYDTIICREKIKICFRTIKKKIINDRFSIIYLQCIT